MQWFLLVSLNEREKERGGRERERGEGGREMSTVGSIGDAVK